MEMRITTSSGMLRSFDHLNITQPLKLEAIYIKWEHDYSPTAIQLEFEEG